MSTVIAFVFLYLVHGHPEHDRSHGVTDVSQIFGGSQVEDVVEGRGKVVLAHLVEAERPVVGVVRRQTDVIPEKQVEMKRLL